MKQYALIFRMDILSPESQPNEEQMSSYMESWMAWLESIDAKEKLAEGGNHFSRSGRVIRQGGQDETPYVSQRASVAGYILIHADDLEDATAIAKECPILQGNGTSVEIRELAAPGS